MDYTTVIAKYEKLQYMIKELNTKMAEIAGEVEYTLNEIDKDRYTNGQVQDLFKTRAIPFIPGTKDSYLKTIKSKAHHEDWRINTVKQFMTQFNNIYEKPAHQEVIKSTSLKEQLRHDINTKKLHRILNRYGITLGSDYRRCTIIDLVNQKAKTQKWRQDTLTKNLETITKAIDKNPMVIPSEDINDIVDEEEDLGLHMEGSNFD